MHTFPSILVTLSPLLFILSFPAFMATMWVGVRHHFGAEKRSGLGTCFLVTGAFGLILDAFVIAFIVLDDPHGRKWDSIDSGLLTGVPTVYVLFVVLFTMGIVAMNALWLLTRTRISKS